MENYKIRAWDKKEKRMCSVVAIWFSLGSIILESGIFVYERKLDEVELMQSTGLKDKNGTEIYEGDIVEFKYPYDKRIKTTGVIVWNDNIACFGISMKETTEQYELYRITAENYLTVMGNIYQNPELGIKPSRNFKLVRPKKVYYHAYIKQEENG